MPVTQNRTKWPVSGGAVSVQPGWYQGHDTASIYINIGVTEAGTAAPASISQPLIQPFQIVGPNNFGYSSQFCLPHVSIPTDLGLQVGDNITLQVIETAQHGAPLYNVSDLCPFPDHSSMRSDHIHSVSISHWQTLVKLSL